MAWQDGKSAGKKKRENKVKEEKHDVGDVAVGTAGVLIFPVAPVVGGAMVAGTAVDMAERHESGKRKKAKPWTDE